MHRARALCFLKTSSARRETRETCRARCGGGLRIREAAAAWHVSGAWIKIESLGQRMMGTQARALRRATSAARLQFAKLYTPPRSSAFL